MTNEELRDLMVGISKRTGLSFGEIDYVAQMTVQAEYDPLPPAEWGPRFEFSSRKVSVFDDQYDFNCINANVPKPNAGKAVSFI